MRGYRISISWEKATQPLLLEVLPSRLKDFVICYVRTSCSIYSKSAKSLFCTILNNQLPVPDISANIYLVRFYFIDVTFGHWCCHVLGLTKFLPFPVAFGTLLLFFSICFFPLAYLY